MKSTERFKQTIEEYLNSRALMDELFANTLSKENKNIDDCIKFILNTVKKSGCNGFTDDEIFSMAIHYYDEDNIDVGGDIKMDVVVNHKVELTEEEKNEAKEKAIRELITEQKSKLKKNDFSKKEHKTIVTPITNKDNITTDQKVEKNTPVTQQTLF
jgi:hypothetical protein